MIESIKSFIKKETVLCVAFICACITMIFVPIDSTYIEYIDVKTLCLLFCLMGVVAAVKELGIFKLLTTKLLSSIKNGKVLSVTLCLLPFFSSMVITNDVALIVFVPFTLGLLDELNENKAIIPMLVIQTIAANLGSMATPVGNPQNLFLYANYNLSVSEFFMVMLPLTLLSLIGIVVASIPILPKTLNKIELQDETLKDKKKLVIYIILFIICLLTVFKFVNYIITTLLVLITFICIDRKLLKELDYALLFTFVCFFVVSGNLGRVEVISNFLESLLNKNALLTSIASSQVISNVPAAVLLSTFTNNWKELLEGVNIGGLGTPIASLASLITLKLYLRHPNTNALRFLSVFMIANIIGLILLTSYAMIF